MLIKIWTWVFVYDHSCPLDYRLQEVWFWMLLAHSCAPELSMARARVQQTLGGCLLRLGLGEP